MNPLPRRLREARKSIGFSQYKLGVAAGLHPATSNTRMSHYELGKRTPDFLTLKRIGEITGHPVAFFYAEDDLLAQLIISYKR